MRACAGSWPPQQPGGCLGIDKDDITGFKNSGGIGSPIDNAIVTAKAAFDGLQLQASGG